MLSEFVECTFSSGDVATAGNQPKLQLLLCPFSITVSSPIVTTPSSSLSFAATIEPFRIKWELRQSVCTLTFHYVSFSVCSSVLEEEGEEAVGAPHPPPFFPPHFSENVFSWSYQSSIISFISYNTVHNWNRFPSRHRLWMYYSTSSLGDCSVHRLRENKSPFVTCVLNSRLKRVTIPDTVLIQLSSWRWALWCSKHVEECNKFIRIKNLCFKFVKKKKDLHFPKYF